MRRRIITLLLIGAVAICGFAAFSLARSGGDDAAGPAPTPSSTPAPTADARLANLFVDASPPAAKTCTRSDTRIAYAPGTACASFDDAYHAARQGDRVLVKGGTYPAQVVGDDATKHDGRCDVRNEGDCVVLRPAPDEKVTLADLTVRCWNCSFSSFDFTRTGAAGDGGPSAKGGRYVVLADMRATGFYIAQEAGTPKPRDIHVYGGEYGPLTTCPGGGMKIGSEVSDSPTEVSEMPADITVEGTYIHDYTVTPGCAEDHMDCVHARALSGSFRFLRNRVERCQNYALLIDGNTAAVKDDILVENNMIGPSVVGPASLALHGGAPGD